MERLAVRERPRNCTFFNMIFELILVVSLAVLTSAYLRLQRNRRMLKDIPGPKGIPILGNTLQLGVSLDKLFKFFRDVYREHGNISKFDMVFINGINIYEPDDVEVILSSTKNNVKWIPYVFMQPWLGKGLLVNNGEKWHHRRKLLTSAFHFNILKKFAKTFTEQTEEFVTSLQKETDKEKTEILPHIMEHTLRIICETSMGTTMCEGIQSVSNQYLNSLFILGECVTYRVSRIWLHLEMMFALSKIANVQKRALAHLHQFTKKIIQERREYRRNNDVIMEEDEHHYGKTRVAMLDMLLDQEKQGKIDDDGIREEVDTFMFEGHDTTATGLCLMIMRIANEPQAQEKIYQELVSIFGDSDREPTVDDLTNMKYLECCIKESLRLYPSVPYIARTLAEQVVLSGHKIPAGTVCSLHIFDIHRRHDIYPEPEKFIPERFLPENMATRHPYAYLPFSAGPRNCIGQKFAILEMKAIVCGLLRKYRLEPVTKPEECQFVCDIVLRTKEPVYVRLRNREK